MVVECTGTRELDFLDSSGKQVKGVSLYILYPEDGVVGKKADKLFVKPSVPLPKGLKPGDMISIAFDIKGKPFAITMADQSSKGFPTK